MDQQWMVMFEEHARRLERLGVTDPSRAQGTNEQTSPWVDAHGPVRTAVARLLVLLGSWTHLAPRRGA